jgi:endonuclease-3
MTTAIEGTTIAISQHDETLSPETLQTPKKRKGQTRLIATSRKSAVVTPEPGSKEPPKGWLEIYNIVEELRRDRTAPVDSNGSEALPERHRGDKVFRLQVLICLMLSSQTKDGVVGDTIRALQAHGLDVDSISAMPSEQLNSIIGKVGFHNNKTKYIKQVVEILKSDYDGDIPSDAEEIMKLPGVGPKMAFIVESVAWNKTSGIGVDTHMHRMFNELRWVSSKSPEQTRIQLESWLPREYWPTVNLLWVGFGQEVQQFKPKLLRKALDCGQPAKALRLLRKLGLDYVKEGEKLGLGEAIRDAMNGDQNSKSFS